MFDEPLFQEIEQNVIESTRQEIEELEASIKKQKEHVQFLADQLNKDVAKKLEKARHLRSLELEEAERLRKEEAKRKAEQELEETLFALERAKARLDNLELVAWPQAKWWQKEDVVTIFNSFMENTNGFVNANDMSLGKTYESIAVLEAMMKEDPGRCLWLTKSQILKTGGTVREFNKFSDLKVVSIEGSMPKAQREFTFKMLGSLKDIVILTNYEAVRTTKELSNLDFKYCVMDEVHKLKGGANPSGPTGVWKAVKDFCHSDNGPEFTMMLTGTPMVNRVAELWAYLHIFDPDRFYSLREFENAFNAYIDMGGKVDTNRILELCLKDRMIRRTRKEVYSNTEGTSSPDAMKIERTVEYLPEQQRVYNQMKEKFYIWLDEQDDNILTATAIVAQLIRLRQISVWPVFKQTRRDPVTGLEDTIEIDVPESAKIDEAMDLIEDANDQVVVFCNFNTPFKEIQRRCSEMNLRCEMITGETKDMSSFEVDFQQGKIDVLCINAAMGEGLNLHKNKDSWPGGSNIAIMLDRWWNPARDEQCIARLRPGLNDLDVLAYYIHNPKSVDNYIAALSDEKAAMFGEIMEDSRIRPKLDVRKLIEGEDQ